MSDNQSGRGAPSYDLVKMGALLHQEWVGLTRQHYGLGPLKKEVSADTFQDARDWGGALNAAAWTFTEVCPEKSVLLFNNTKEALRAAILRYAEIVRGE